MLKFLKNVFGRSRHPVRDLAVLAKFYRGKKVFITGHTGFKGSWLAFWLTEMGAEVCGYALPYDVPPWKWPLTEFGNYGYTGFFTDLGLAARVARHEYQDVRDAATLQRVVREFQPDIVFHLAAQAFVREGYKHPQVTLDVNVNGVHHLLWAIHAQPSVRVCQIITSDKCYDLKRPGTGCLERYIETDALGGEDPYSNSKAEAEKLVAITRNYFSAGILSLATCRAGNVVGGGDWGADRLVPDCMRALAKAHPIVLRNPAAVRPWQFVLDVLTGYLLLGYYQWHDPAGFAEAWNFGPSEVDVTALQLAGACRAAWATRTGTHDLSPLHVTPCPELPEAAHLHLDSGKADRRLRWKALTGIADMVAMTTEWYVQNAMGNNDVDFVVKLARHQIKQHTERFAAAATI